MPGSSTGLIWPTSLVPTLNPKPNDRAVSHEHTSTVVLRELGIGAYIQKLSLVLSKRCRFMGQAL